MNLYEADLKVCKGGHPFYQAALGFFFDLYQRTLSKKNIFTVVLCGGKTPEGIHSRLADPAIQKEIDWSKVHLFWGDERFVPSSHSESNYGAVKKSLISKIDIPASNVHPIETDRPDPRDAAKIYEELLRNFFKIKDASFPRFDLIFLGVGEDGHTASLFPNSKELNEKKRWVVSSYIEKSKSQRITMTFPVINQAENILILATGEKKAGILKEIFKREGPSPYPIQQIHPAGGKLTFLVDQAAASRLSFVEPPGFQDRINRPVIDKNQGGAGNGNVD